LLEALRPRVEGIATGDPLKAGTKMGPMIRERDAVRVGEWISEAASQGARVVCGGSRTGSLLAPTLVADVQPTMRIAQDELFGPAVGVFKAPSIDEAIALANHSRYGLSAGIFTQDIDAAIRFSREVDSGNLHINWGPAWRADLMPYGGLKDSGFGKEGPRYAIHEMTEMKTVIIHGKT
jgi:acyl-CoA reductase-like NAD-dependent aldehyde dehydrogenase